MYTNKIYVLLPLFDYLSKLRCQLFKFREPNYSRKEDHIAKGKKMFNGYKSKAEKKTNWNKVNLAWSGTMSPSQHINISLLLKSIFIEDTS